MKVFNSKPDFFRFINNYEGELVIRKNCVFDGDELVAQIILK